MAHEGNPAADDAMVQTLNSALGNLGGRQKSWMVPSNTTATPAPSDLTVKPAPPTVRRRGRPRKNLAPPSRQQPTIDHARPSIEPPTERQPPSNSTSPYLANVVTGSDRMRLHPPVVIVFPSPTPSEENTRNTAMPALRGDDGMVDHDVPRMESTGATHIPTERVDLDTVRRAGLRRKQPSVEAVVHMEKRRRPDEARQEQPTAMAGASGLSCLPAPNISRPPSIPHSYVHSPHLEQTHSRSPSLGQMSSGPVQSPQLARGFHDGASETPPQTCALSGPQHTSSWGLADPVSVAPPDMVFFREGYDVPARRPQQNIQSAWYTTPECLRILDEFHHSQASAASSPTERSRLGVLRAAVDTEDWAYLTMHQIYCLLDCDRNSLPDEILKQPALAHAQGVMRNVLESNKQLSPAVLHFFAGYPYQLEDIRARWPATFDHQTHLFLSFVRYSQYYKDVTQTCEARRFPPLAWELSQRLGINSSTFQRILFTAVLRALWQWLPPHENRSKYEAEAIRLFQQNRIEYLQKLTVAGPHPTQMTADHEADLSTWGPRLRAVVEEKEKAAHLSYMQQSTHLQQNSQHGLRAEMPQPLIQAQGVQHVTQQSQRPGRPRTRPIPSSCALQSNDVQRQPKLVPLLPPPGWTQPQQRQPNPTRFSLHHAHLQSPVLKGRSVQSPLYQYVQGFVKPPKRLSHVERAVEKWSFYFDADMMASVPATLQDRSGVIDERLVDTNSKTIRLRCIKWPAAANRPDDHTWATTDTSWIPHSYFSFNGVSLTQRKKVHHGKDLHIDVTHLVTEGENVLEMTVMAESKDKAYLNYLVAIEFLGITSHDKLKHDCLEKNLIPAEQVLSDIKRKLRGSNEDDDIAIVKSNLTINLFDPFSASKICDIPVRSRACLHPDCFDLETFLQTRRRKGDASMPDLWRCPICNSDARPEFLVVDGFLQEVKQRLDAQGLSNTRAIVVQQDGTWQPKAEVREGVSDDPPTPILRRKSTVPVEAEIIDLSD